MTTTWGEVFNRKLAQGHDHGSAAYEADQSEKRAVARGEHEAAPESTETTGRIPVSAAKRVAKDHNLSQCILIGWDGEQVHVVTYGSTKEDCALVARAQDFWSGKIREFSFKGDAS